MPDTTAEWPRILFSQISEAYGCSSFLTLSPFDSIISEIALRGELIFETVP